MANAKAAVRRGTSIIAIVGASDPLGYRLCAQELGYNDQIAKYHQGIV
jgi:hypothetical protein